jgi:hypothetical protein
MHTAMHLLGYWALAFVTLSAAVVLLNIFDGLMGNDLILLSVGKEAAIAGIASVVEGGSLWLVVSFLPMAARALIVPALIVALIYKIAHLEDWSRYDVMMLLLFQGILFGVALCLLAGQFLAGLIVLVVFVLALILIVALARVL